MGCPFDRRQCVSDRKLWEEWVMAKVFIPYGTTEGQTAKIAEYIADVLRDHGHEADPVDINESPDRVPAGTTA